MSARKKKCAACGHTAADHPEGYVGAKINGVPYCHVDDHSCYTEALQARRPVFDAGAPS